MNTIYVSYAQSDADEVLPVISALSDEGYAVSYNESGMGLNSSTEKQIDECGSFVAFVSEEYALSSICQAEFNYAISGSKEIVSIFLSSANEQDKTNMAHYSAATINRSDYSGEYGFIKEIMSCPQLNG